jgi:hypothetical protein
MPPSHLSPLAGRGEYLARPLAATESPMLIKLV